MDDTSDFAQSARRPLAPPLSCHARRHARRRAAALCLVPSTTSVAARTGQLLSLAPLVCGSHRRHALLPLPRGDRGAAVQCALGRLGAGRAPLSDGRLPLPVRGVECATSLPPSPRARSTTAVARSHPAGRHAIGPLSAPPPPARAIAALPALALAIVGGSFAVLPDDADVLELIKMLLVSARRVADDGAGARAAGRAAAHHAV